MSSTTLQEAEASTDTTRKALSGAQLALFSSHGSVEAQTNLEVALAAYETAVAAEAAEWSALTETERDTWRAANTPADGYVVRLDDEAEADRAEVEAIVRLSNPNGPEAREHALASIQRDRGSLDAMRNPARRAAIDAAEAEYLARCAVWDAATDEDETAALAAHDQAVAEWERADTEAKEYAPWLREQDFAPIRLARKAVAHVVKPVREWAVGSVVLQRASDIVPLRAVWLQNGRIPLGELTLVAGGEGTGKSTYLYDIAARITCGQLDGEFHGQPKAVLVAATEDAWAQTIVPRLMAAGADLNRVIQVETSSRDGLSFPRDNDALADIARAEDVALLIVDPLTSRLGSADTHKDSDVRKALEPLVAVAHDNQFAICAIIHLNKNENLRNITNQILGSKAFSAVARSILAVFPDPLDDSGERKQVGLIKCNLTRLEADQADLFRIESRTVSVSDPYSDELCDTSVGAIAYLGKSTVSMKSASNPETFAEERDGEAQVQALIEAIRESDRSLTPGRAKRVLTDQFDISDRTAARRIGDAVKAGRIVSNGATTSRTYTLPD